MPVIYRYHGFVFFFYSSDRQERMHVHVRKGDGVAKYWLNPVDLFKSSGFRSTELREIREIIEQNHEIFIEQWNRYFS
jgi:Domain of unknown function (DUF4160)